jgi:hypothetical protein
MVVSVSTCAVAVASAPVKRLLPGTRLLGGIAFQRRLVERVDLLPSFTGHVWHGF